MDIHEYNKTFYYGLSSLFFLGIISLFTYLFKFKNIQNFINLFILFIILLLVIYCSSIFKDNIIEDYINKNTTTKMRYKDLSGALWEDVSGADATKLINIAVPIADEPFGRFNVSYFDSGQINSVMMCNCFKDLYKVGYRGFHFYVEYPVGSNKPMCVFPYKNIEGMNAISTRGKKIPFGDVFDAVTSTGANGFRPGQPIFLCLTCLSPEQENSIGAIKSTLKSGRFQTSIDICLNTIKYSQLSKIYVTLGTYDNIPLTNSPYPSHYYIKENDLKYASFNVVTGFGLYAPLINYTKTQQDTFNARGYDEDIQQSVNLAYLNGVQFVCIPPTYDSGLTLGIDKTKNYDYPATNGTCREYFTDSSTNTVYPYRIRTKNILGAFNNMEEHIQNKFNLNSSRIDILNSTVAENSKRLNDADTSFADISEVVEDTDFTDILDTVGNQGIAIQAIEDAFVTHRGQHKRLQDHLDDS